MLQRRGARNMRAAARETGKALDDVLPVPADAIARGGGSRRANAGQGVSRPRAYGDPPIPAGDRTPLEKEAIVRARVMLVEAEPGAGKLHTGDCAGARAR